MIVLLTQLVSLVIYGYQLYDCLQKIKSKDKDSSPYKKSHFRDFTISIIVERILKCVAIIAYIVLRVVDKGEGSVVVVVTAFIFLLDLVAIVATLVLRMRYVLDIKS